MLLGKDTLLNRIFFTVFVVLVDLFASCAVETSTLFRINQFDSASGWKATQHEYVVLKSKSLQLQITFFGK